MAWLFLGVGIITGFLCIISGFSVTGLAVICGLSFVTAALFDVASAVRQLGQTSSSLLPQSFLLPKKLKLSSPAKEEPPEV